MLGVMGGFMVYREMAGGRIRRPQTSCIVRAFQLRT